MKPVALGDRIDEFIAHKRALGYKYETGSRYLEHYRKHMEACYPDLDRPDMESTESFLARWAGKPGALVNAIGPLREFGRHLVSIGIEDAYLVPPKQTPKLHPEPPYFFSESELAAFFHTCDTCYAENPGPRVRGLVMPPLFRTLYCCGLRPKEARALLVGDVHLADAHMDVLQSKGPKNRRVFLSTELAEHLRGYDMRMRALWPDRIHFFPQTEEKAVSQATLEYNFHLVWDQCNPGRSGRRPRVYDFRHHFAWANINRWARERVDVGAMLPCLARYMGHNDIKHTLYYFRFVPDFHDDYRKLSDALNDRIPEVEE